MPAEGTDLWVMFSFRDSNSRCCFCVSYQSFKILACAAGVNTKEQMKSWAAPLAKLWVWKPNTVMAANTTACTKTQRVLFSAHVRVRPGRWDYTRPAVTTGC